MQILSFIAKFDSPLLRTGVVQLQRLVRREELPDQPEAAADCGRRLRLSHDDHRLRGQLLLLQGPAQEKHSK